MLQQAGRIKGDHISGTCGTLWAWKGAVHALARTIGARLLYLDDPLRTVEAANDAWSERTGVPCPNASAAPRASGLRHGPRRFARPATTPLRPRPGTLRPLADRTVVR